MLKIVPIATLVIGLAGCAIPPKAVEYTISAPFDEQAAAAQMQPGSGVLHGNAFMRQRGGGVVTCAGSDVVLQPVTAYASERIVDIYGSGPAVGDTVALPIRDAIHTKVSFSPDIPAYRDSMRHTRCDGQGDFEFSSLRDGNYYVVTRVVWQVGALPQGAFLMAQIKVGNGKVDKIIMSR